jgi:hypothetical protein
MICAGCGKIVKKFEEYCSECAVLLSKSSGHRPESHSISERPEGEREKDEVKKEHTESGHFEQKESILDSQRTISKIQEIKPVQTAIKEVQEAKPPAHIKSADNQVIEVKKEAVRPPAVVSPEMRAVQEPQQSHATPIVAEKMDKTILKIEEKGMLLKEVRGPQTPYSPHGQITAMETKRAEKDKEVQEEIRMLREELERLRSTTSQTRKETRPRRETNIDEMPVEVSDQFDSIMERRSPQRFDSLDTVDKEKEKQQFGRREDVAAPPTHTQVTESKIPTLQPTPMRQTQPQTQYPQTRPRYQTKPTVPPTPQRAGLEFQRQYGQQVETRPPHTVETRPVGLQKDIETRAPEKLRIIEETLYSCPHCRGEFSIEDSEVENKKAEGTEVGEESGEKTEEVVDKIVICPHCRKEIILGHTGESLF